MRHFEAAFPCDWLPCDVSLVQLCGAAVARARERYERRYDKEEKDGWRGGFQPNERLACFEIPTRSGCPTVGHPGRVGTESQPLA